MNWIKAIFGSQKIDAAVALSHREKIGRLYRIEMWEAKDGWRSRIMHKNGNILFNSEGYSSKAACMRTAKNFAKLAGMDVLTAEK